MILFLGTSLVAVKAKKFVTVFLFFIITQALWLVVLSHSFVDVSEAYGMSVIVDMVAGVFFYLYTKYYLPRKPREQAERALNKISKWLSVLLLVALTISVALLYSGIQKGQEIMAKVKAERPLQKEADTRPISTQQTEEDTGFGIIPDPMLWNSESGKPTYSNSAGR